MGTRGRRSLLGVGAALYLLALGFPGGVAAERLSFDQRRAAILRRSEDATRAWRATLMTQEVEHHMAAARPGR